MGGVDHGMGGHLGVLVCSGHDCLRRHASHVCG